MSNGKVWQGDSSGDMNVQVQLYCEEGSRKEATYKVNAVLRNGETRVLLAGLDELGQALWIEQKIEARPGIQDEPVGSEVRR